MNGKGGTFYVWLAVFAVAFAVAPGRLDAALIGVTAVPEETPYVLGDEPVTLLLSKSRYPAEDRHLDAIVWLTAPDGARADGSLEVSLHDEQGATRARDAIRPLPGERVFFSLVFPADMAGRHGSVRVVWVSGDQEIGRAEQSFAVLPATGVSTSGRIRLRVPNAAGAVWRGVPVTVGVPFPRGALTADANVRLADADGQEIPLQTRVTSRWSRFGSIRWMQCDFAVDVDGRAREVFLEYGPNVTRSASEGLRLTYPDLSHGALPMVHAGAVRFGENGIEFDAGDGRGHRQIVAPEGLSGAFVEHENGKVFHMPAGTPWEIEEQGAQKIADKRPFLGVKIQRKHLAARIAQQKGRFVMAQRDGGRGVTQHVVTHPIHGGAVEHRNQTQRRIVDIDLVTRLGLEHLADLQIQRLESRHGVEADLEFYRAILRRNRHRVKQDRRPHRQAGKHLHVRFTRENLDLLGEHVHGDVPESGRQIIDLAARHPIAHLKFALNRLEAFALQRDRGGGNRPIVALTRSRLQLREINIEGHRPKEQLRTAGGQQPTKHE